MKHSMATIKKDRTWIERTLGEVGSFVGGGTPSTSNHKYWNGDIAWYTPKEIKQGILKPSIRTISKEGLKNSSAKLLPKGTILITTRATIGAVAIATKECATNQGFQSLIVKETEVNMFWYYWILMNKHELLRRSSGSTFNEIGKKEMQRILTLSPGKKEQQKIATILSTWDQAIASTQSIIDTLTLRNKGLAQQLLTGNKRLKGFQGSWREERLGNLLKEVKSDVVKSPQQYELLNVKLYGKGISKTGKFPKKTTKGRTYHFRRPGEIIIGRQNFHNGSIALMPTLKGKLIASSAISSFFAVKEVDTQWILHYLLRPSFYTWIANLIGGTGQKEISRKDFNTILIIVPPLEEQKAISQVLVDAEQEVKLYKKKLDKLQEQKKGLMQKLLTGAIRTNNF